MVQLPIYRVKQRHLEAYVANGLPDGRLRLPAGGRGHARNVSGIPRQPGAAASQECPEDADRIRRGHRTRNVGLILNVLCMDGYIPAGRYIIDTHPEPPPGQVYRALLLKTGDSNHPECLAFNREHRQRIARLHNW